MNTMQEKLLIILILEILFYALSNKKTPVIYGVKHFQGLIHCIHVYIPLLVEHDMRFIITARPFNSFQSLIQLRIIIILLV